MNYSTGEIGSIRVIAIPTLIQQAFPSMQDFYSLTSWRSTTGSLALLLLFFFRHICSNVLFFIFFSLWRSLVVCSHSISGNRINATVVCQINVGRYMQRTHLIVFNLFTFFLFIIGW